MNCREFIRTEAGVALTMGLMGLILFTVLLTFGVLPPTHYCILVPILFVVCLVIWGFVRIREFDILKGRVSMTEIRATRQDIFASKEDFEHLTVALGKVIAVRSLFDGRFWDGKTLSALSKGMDKLFDNVVDHITNDQARQELLPYVAAMRGKIPVKDLVYTIDNDSESQDPDTKQMETNSEVP